MKLLADTIPKGCHGIRIWFDESGGGPDSGEPYDLTCILWRVSAERCEVRHAKGELNNDAAIMIGLKAIELGYKTLHFTRSAGGPASRWALLKGTIAGFDHYDVDLHAAVAELAKMAKADNEEAG